MPDEEIQQASERQFNPVEEEQTVDGALSAGDGSSAATAIVSDAPDGEAPQALPFPVVGIGASAGGVEAYIELFQYLPSETGMAFVIIPHLSADQRSYLPEIIGRHTKMPAVSIENGARLEPDHVYLLPPNARASLQEGIFHLEARAGAGVPHPIDFFFRSLAIAQKTRAIGVVLSGMDSDGAMGLRAIKAEGGISIVQAPESARFPEMPRSSISADHVDIVLPPDQIALRLSELAERLQKPDFRLLEQGTPPPDEEKYLERLVKLLKGVSGVDFRLYKPSTIRRRIARRMLMHRVDSLAEYVSFLNSNTQELRDLHEDVLIGVTRFFRDPEVFDALKQVVFPTLFQNRTRDQQLRMWVAGCSSGEEVYSLAICLLEFLNGTTQEPPIQIFATDASEQSIQTARLGIYPETISNEVSGERLRRFFVKNEKGYQISKRIRDLCIFARQNLCHDPPFSRLDLISCRNVLIYFGSQLQNQLIPTFHYALRPQGFLLLGNSETIRGFSELFALTDRQHRIYSKTDSASAPGILELSPRRALADLPDETPDLGVQDAWSDFDLQRAADRIVLARYGPPGLIVNERMEILQSRGHTSPFLELSPGIASLHLARMIRESIAPQVTTAVKRAIDQDLPVQEGLVLSDGEQKRKATLEVLPVHTVGSRARCYLVLFVPMAAESGLAAAEPRRAEIKQGDADGTIAHLRQELSSTKLYLRSLVEERDAKNQELVAANEEIQSANEELQSTNEELETTKEELQSSNEELQTVNDELQNRNVALTQTSNDLTNLLNSVNLPLLMLGNDLDIRHFTPQSQRLINVRSTDIGRPVADIRLNLNIDNLEPLFAEVLETLGPREIEVQDREGHWYLLRVRPYRTTENKIDGLVVVLVDIDQLRRSQQELRDARDLARSIIESVPLPLAVVDSGLRIRSTNEAFCALANSSSQGLERRFLPDLAGLMWGMEQPLLSRIEALRDGKNGRSFEFEHKTSEENPKIFLVRGRVLRPDGEQFLLVTFEDISVHKEVERLLTLRGERLASEVAATTRELDRSRDELRALTGSLLTSQEEERRRLARELHDDVSQRLAALNMLGDEVMRGIAADPAPARQKLQEALNQIGQLSDDVRTLSHRLHPSMIEHLGLAPALRSLTEEFGEREDMIASFSARNVPENLPVEIATGLYRIAQEALRNIAKHAGKTHVKVTLAGNAGTLELQIADAGQGFDAEQNHSGLGLISMKERARLIGAAVKIQSALGEGTRVTVTVPLASA